MPPQHSRFDFMGLPVEVRQMVYRELLEGETSTEVPPIALASQQLRREVQDTDIVPHIFIECNHVSKVTIAVSVEGTRHIVVHKEAFDLAGLMLRAELLQRYKSLVMEFKFVPSDEITSTSLPDTAPTFGNTFHVDQVLPCLASILSFGCLKSVTVVNHFNVATEDPDLKYSLDMTPCLTENDLQQVFAHLAILNPDIRISFENVPTAVAAEFVKLHRPRSCALSEWFQLERDVPEVVNRLRERNAESYGAAVLLRTLKPFKSSLVHWRQDLEEIAMEHLAILRRNLEIAVKRELEQEEQQAQEE